MEKEYQSGIDILRSMWHFAAISHFCRCFKGKLGFKITPRPQDIEDSFLNPDTNIFFHELHIKILTGLRRWKASQLPITLNTYPDLLQQTLKSKLENIYSVDWRDEYQ